MRSVIADAKTTQGDAQGRKSVPDHARYIYLDRFNEKGVEFLPLESVMNFKGNELQQGQNDAA